MQPGDRRQRAYPPARRAPLPGPHAGHPNGVDLSDLDPGKIRLGEPPQNRVRRQVRPAKNPLQIIRTSPIYASLPSHWRDGWRRPVAPGSKGRNRKLQPGRAIYAARLDNSRTR